MKNPKILIGCPTFYLYEYALDEYLRALKSLDYPYYDILLVDNSPDEKYYNLIKSKNIDVERVPYVKNARDRIIRARNVIRERVLEGGYDYLFSVEQDVIIPPNTLTRLLNHKKKVVSALYTKPMNVTILNHDTGEKTERKMDLPVVYLPSGNGKIRRAFMPEVYGKGLIKVGNVGLGCLLIKKDVLAGISFRYDPSRAAFDDMFFGLDCKQLGIDLFLDSDLLVKHDDRVKWDNLKR